MDISEAMGLSKRLGSDTARLDTELLLCSVLNCSPSYLRIWPDRSLSEEQEQQFKALIARREKGEPVAYLIGHQAFWSLDLKVSSATLIPRPDTETLVEVALSLPVKTDANVLDLGTGTGAIALALAKERPDWQVGGVDYSDEIVELARENAVMNNLEHVTFIKSNWFAQIGNEHFDIIVSNPPYIDPEDQHLEQGDVRFEPKTALVAQDQGLADIQQIINAAGVYLNANGWLAFEHGFDQAEKVQKLFELASFANITTRKDLAGNDRVTYAQLRRFHDM